MKIKNLQQELKDQINEFSGIDQLTLNTNRLEKVADNADKIHFKDIATYFKALFTLAYVPVEEHAIKFGEKAKMLVKLLDKYAKKLKCKVAIFLRDLVQFKLDYVEKIKTITG